MNLRFLETIKDKLFILCNPNGDELKIIDHREESLEIWLNDIWTLNFTVDNLNKDSSDYNDYYDLIVKDRIVKIQNIGEFIITDYSEVDNGTSKIKQVTCKSLEYELSNKIINYLECKAYKFYDTIPEKISDTFLGIVMSKLPNWTIGNVDIELYSKYRVFDISSDTSLYNLIIEQAQPAYECIFQFDRLDKTVNVYTRDNIVKDTDIIISFDNLVNEIGINPISDGYCNMLSVTGANDMGINLINPLGTNEIYNLDSIINTPLKSGIGFITENTSNAWKVWKIKYDELKVGYATNVLAIKNKNGQILTTRTQLQVLNAEIKALKESISIFNSFDEDKTDLVNQYNAKVAEANTFENLILSLNSEIQALLLQQTVTNNTLKFEKFFTSNQLKELDRVIKPASFVDENLAITDVMTDVEVIEMSQELFDKGVRQLEIVSKPRYSFDIDMLCPFFVDNFDVHKQQLGLGAKITLFDSRDNYYNPLLIGLSFSFDNLSDVKFTFSESLRNQDNSFEISQLLGKTNSVATNLAINNIKYNSYVDSGDKQVLHKMRTEALNADLNGLINGIDKTVTIDGTGILFRALDENGINGYSPYQSWWNNNILMFSDDYFKHAKMGIGLITLPNGQKAYGVNTDVLMGTINLSEILHIKNANNSFIVDENGATLTNATLSIIGNGGLNKILLDAINGFKIQKKNGNIFEDMIYLGADGEACFKGKIFGGSININNSFKVNSDGTVEMASGTLKSFQSLMSSGKGLKVDNGNVTIDGNLILGGNITWNVHDPLINGAYDTANSAYALANSANANIVKLANGQYTGTFIDGTALISPSIFTNMLDIKAPNNISESGLVLKGYFENKLYNMFKISYWNGGSAPYINLDSMAYVNFNPSEMNFNGVCRFYDAVSFGSPSDKVNVDFSNANVTGVTARFA